MDRKINQKIYSKYYNATMVHIPWIKDTINKNGNLKIDVKDLPKYFGPDMTGDIKIICRALQKLLFKEGILVSIKHEYGNKDRLYVEFFTFDVNIANKDIDIISKEMKEKFHKFLKDNKLYGDKFLVCPVCNRYNVEFAMSSHMSNHIKSGKKWWCNHCLKSVPYYDYDLNIDDKDKYHIYKLWGTEALSIFTKDTMKNTVEFIASYFKNCCVTKKDRCLYFGFFKENEGKSNGEKLQGQL